MRRGKNESGYLSFFLDTELAPKKRCI